MSDENSDSNKKKSDSAVNPVDNIGLLNRREALFRFAGAAGMASLAIDALQNLTGSGNQAQAANWKKLGVSGVAGSRARLPARNGKIRNSIGGSQHSIVIRSDGRVFACGYNGRGQHGDNTTTNRSTYIQSTGI